MHIFLDTTAVKSHNKRVLQRKNGYERIYKINIS